MRAQIYYDSGAGDTIFNNLKWFTELHPLPQPKPYLCADGAFTSPSHMGVVAFETTLSSGTKVTLEMTQALYNPDSPVNLVSSGMLLDNDIFWNQKTNELYRGQDGIVVCEMQRAANVFLIPAKPTQIQTAVSMAATPHQAVMASINYRTMHRRLMHAGKSAIEKACRDAGITLTGKDDTFCEPCIFGKATDEHGKVAPIQGTKFFDFIRVDTVTHKFAGHLGYYYSIHIIDVFTSFHWVRYARKKSDIFALVTNFVEMVYNQTGDTPRCIPTQQRLVA